MLYSSPFVKCFRASRWVSAEGAAAKSAARAGRQIRKKDRDADEAPTSSAAGGPGSSAFGGGGNVTNEAAMGRGACM